MFTLSDEVRGLAMGWCTVHNFRINSESGRDRSPIREE